MSAYGNHITYISYSPVMPHRTNRTLEVYTHEEWVPKFAVWVQRSAFSCALSCLGFFTDLETAKDVARCSKEVYALNIAPVEVAPSWMN